MTKGKFQVIRDNVCIEQLLKVTYSYLYFVGIVTGALKWP